MNKQVLIIIPLALLLLGGACTKKAPITPTTNVNSVISNPAGALTMLNQNELANKQIRLETTKGTIIFQLFGQEAPIAVSNFITLTSKGFYNSLTFHRYEPSFVIQGGDPQGTGVGGPGYTFKDEPVSRDYLKGIVAMANAGPNTNGSQFFIMLEDAPQLPKLYTIFGKVTTGLEVMEQLRQGDIMNKVTVEPLGAP